MKIQEVFDLLAQGEFSQLSIGGAEPGVINEASHARVVGHISLGLTALYRRFNLKENGVGFDIEPGAETYKLDVPDLLKVERVVADSGHELTINDFGDSYTCFTPALNTLRLSPKLQAQGPDTPEHLKTKSLMVYYRANHPKIIGSSGFLIAETKQIELPPSHLQALLYYVASRVHNPVGMVNEFHAGNTWYAKYEAECRGLENDGYKIQEFPCDTRFRDRGWV